MKNDTVDEKSSRRRFLKRSSAGVILASLPAASVWGQENSSIAASGVGSNGVSARSISLLSPGYWKNHTGDWGSISTSATYYDYTGSLPFGVGYSHEMSRLTLLEILENPGNGKNGQKPGKYGGPGNINVFIVDMLLNAANHGRTLSGQLVSLPVISSSSFGFSGSNNGTFSSLRAFGEYLHGSAIGNERAVARELSSLVDDNHA